MRRYLILAILAVAVGCSNSSTKNADPNADPNNQVDTGGSDAANNNTGDSGRSDAGGTDTGSSDSGVADTGGADASPADTGADMSLPPSPCPDDAPAAATACAEEGLQCEYGPDPRESCRTRGECTGGSWAVTTPRCEPLPAVTCPMTREDASGELCDTMDAYCDYEGLVCHCTNCVDGPVVVCEGDPTWMCDFRNPDPQCPAAKPRLGDSCGADGKACTYKCGPDGARECIDGTWRSADGGPCPISTARVKRDIRYLGAGELAEISAAVQAIPLARWQYTDPALGRGEKLGFIIEDLPSATPAVDRDRLMVDLYGYTSMLVADAQAREKRMRQIEERLLELEQQAMHCGE